jgi:hypothetical protein
MIDLAETFVTTITNADGSTSVDVDLVSVRFVDPDHLFCAAISRSPFHRGMHLAHLWDIGVMSPHADIRTV